MTKEELEKEAEEWLCNNLHSASEEDFIKAMVDIAEPREKQIQIDAEQIRALQKQNGELTDKVKKLEAEVREWKDKADLWCNTANLKDHNIMINKELEKENAELRNNGFTVSAMTEQQLKVALEKGEQLEKENAELKEKVNILDNCDRLGDVITEAYKEQLTKAKNLLQNVADVCGYPNYDIPIELYADIEHFISEVEKC